MKTSMIFADMFIHLRKNIYVLNIKALIQSGCESKLIKVCIIALEYCQLESCQQELNSLTAALVKRKTDSLLAK